MSLIPDGKNNKVTFVRSKVPPWTTNAVAIGTTADAVTDLDTKLTAAQTAIDAQVEAHEHAKTSTVIADAAVAAMASAAADIIKSIRAKAAVEGDTVWTLAELPLPPIPGPSPAPGKPTDLTVTLDSSGALNLKWKCPNPAGTAGTMYRLWRRNGPTGDFAYIGGTGSKSFADDTLPAGSSQLTYRIQAVRSTAVGSSADFNVNFGVSSSGGATASVVETSPTRIAA